MNMREPRLMPVGETGSADVTGMLIDHLDLWTGAVTTKSTAGRGRNGKIELTGIRKLRELILELAVRGKLVEQDPNDEPASVLLERIAEEKARLVKEGKIKKPKKLPEIDEEEVTTELPTTWSWARLGEITNYGVTDKAEPGEVEDTSWVLELEDIEKESSRLVQRVTYRDRPFKSSKNRFIRGDVLYGKLRPYLDKVLVADRPGVCTTEIIPIRGFNGIFPPYLRLALKSPAFKTYADDSTHGMNLPRLGTDKARLSLIPLPPTEEQNRIVEKVDELMALCDRLVQQVGDQMEAHEVLVDTLLAALTRSTDAAETAHSWARAAEHFDTLFTTEASIDKLKQTILQLAVMGRLVPQDSDDEPAESLLARLASERQDWLESHKDENYECATMLRKLKKLRPPQPPFPLPKGWAAAHLIQLSRVLVDCHNKTAPYVENGIPIIRTSNIRERRFKFDDLKYVNEETYQYWSRRCPPEPKDIIFTREAPMGEAAIIPEGEKWCLGQRTMLIRPMLEHIYEEYLLLTLTEPHLLERASEKAIGSTVKHLRVGDVERISLPVPPLEEQNRIVEKVDELMSLCDHLKSRLGEAGETRTHLAKAVVEQAVS